MSNHFVILGDRARPFTPEVIERHIDHLRWLDDTGHLVICGPFLDYPGGMIILTAEDLDEADRLARQDPFVDEGYWTYQVRSLQVSSKENGYGLTVVKSLFL
ncbi:MAG: YciI family protein [Propionibacteriaceae bacterium]|nr:YciI family protein [Propionibacteriaceae bacterium]